MENKTYQADFRLAGNLYRKVRKTYKRYKYGQAIVCILAGFGAGIFCWMYFQMEEISQLPDILVSWCGVAVFIGLPAALTHAWAVSGGYWLNCMRQETCTFTEDDLRVSAMDWWDCPSGWAVPYSQVTEVVDNAREGCLMLITESGIIYKLYAYYPRWEEIQAELHRHLAQGEG